MDRLRKVHYFDAGVWSWLLLCFLFATFAFVPGYSDTEPGGEQTKASVTLEVGQFTDDGTSEDEQTLDAAAGLISDGLQGKGRRLRLVSVAVLGGASGKAPPNFPSALPTSEMKVGVQRAHNIRAALERRVRERLVRAGGDTAKSSRIPWVLVHGAGAREKLVPNPSPHQPGVNRGVTITILFDCLSGDATGSCR